MPTLPRIQGWLRQLEDGDGGARLEIFLKAENHQGQPDRKIRASGPIHEMVELVEWFEEKTGLRVESPVLPKRPPRQLPGQTAMELHLGEPTQEQVDA
jgi:hypothetical protein